MPKLTPLHLLPVLFVNAVTAAELTVEPRPFTIEKSFSATALPVGENVLLRVEPKAWAEFKIAKIADHGSKVAKGDVLISFDTESIDKKLEDARRAAESAKYALAQAEEDTQLLQETAPQRLEAARIAAETAKEENTYFTQTRRKAREEAAAQELKRSEQILENQREELRQLAKMYAADDVTEETEEIILTRQKDAVASAEFGLRMATLDKVRKLEVTLPREAKTLADSERDTAIALKKAELNIPRGVALGKIALQSLKISRPARKKTSPNWKRIANCSKSKLPRTVGSITEPSKTVAGRPARQ